MSRGTRRSSDIFKSVLRAAQDQVLLDKERAALFQHKGIRGDERAASIAQFLRERLPSWIGVGKGEVIDFRDRRTGQLDIVLYDQASCAPISVQDDNLLLPCEALYCVIEVKTTITQDELDKCLVSASKIRDLRPFKESFIPSRRDGADADDGGHRCLYAIFAYTSNLSNDNDWPDKENVRLRSAAGKVGVDVDCIDRLIVIDRGIINPAKAVGKWEAGNTGSLFLESYLHIVNFISRESRRRTPIDWQVYGPRSAQGWRQLTMPAKTVQATVAKMRSYHPR